MERQPPGIFVTHTTLDTRGSRREIWSLIHRLPPLARVRFLVDCCKNVPRNEKGHLPAPTVRGMLTTADQARRSEAYNERLTNEVYADILVLYSQWGLDDVRTATRLELLIRESGF